MAGANLNGVESLQETINDLADDFGGDDIRYRIVTNVEYASYVHFGTSEQAAQPFLTEAAHAVTPDIPDIVAGASSTKAAVSEIALRCLRKAKEYCPVDTGRLRASLSIQRSSGGSWTEMGSTSGEVDLGSGEASVGA